MASRLLLVPEEVLNRWRDKQRLQAVDHPLTTEVTAADHAVSNVLSDPTLSDYDKSALTSHKTAAFRAAHRRHLDPPPPTVQPPPPPPTPAIAQPPNAAGPGQPRGGSDRLIASLPTTYRRAGARLLQVLTDDPEVTWDDTGRVSVAGSVVDNSNIVDLLKDAVRNTTGGPRPPGFEQVVDLVRTKRLPPSLFRNKAWRTPPPPRPWTLDSPPATPRRGKSKRDVVKRRDALSFGAERKRHVSPSSPSPKTPVKRARSPPPPSKHRRSVRAKAPRTLKWLHLDS